MSDALFRYVHSIVEDPSRSNRTRELLARIGEMETELAALRAQVEELTAGPATSAPAIAPLPPTTVTNESSPQEKIALFRRRFRDREDVYAHRWQSKKTGKKDWAPPRAAATSRARPRTASCCR